MATTLLTALLIIFALALILSLSLWVSLRHRSRAIQAAAAAEAGNTHGATKGDKISFFGFGKASNFKRTNTATSTSSAETKYLCPAPGQTYHLPSKQQQQQQQQQQVPGAKIQPHPSIKRKRKAPPLIAAKSAYRLHPQPPPATAPQKQHGIKEEEATSPKHTGSHWPLPLSAQLDTKPQQPPQMGRVGTADGNFEEIYLEKQNAVFGEGGGGRGGAWMGVARRVADRRDGYGYKPLPDVKEEEQGNRHGIFDFERGDGDLGRSRDGLKEPAGKVNGGGWRLTWWGEK